MILDEVAADIRRGAHPGADAKPAAVERRVIDAARALGRLMDFEAVALALMKKARDYCVNDKPYQVVPWDYIADNFVAPALARAHAAGVREAAGVADQWWRCAGHERDCGCALCGVPRGIAKAIRRAAQALGEEG